MIKKKTPQTPTGSEQKQMRQSIMTRLDSIIINWSPKFVVTDENKKLSDTLLSELKKAREILENMFIPREDMRVSEYYRIIVSQLDSLEDSRVLNSLSGEVIIKPLVEKILETTKDWEKLH